MSVTYDIEDMTDVIVRVPVKELGRFYSMLGALLTGAAVPALAVAEKHRAGSTAPEMAPDAPAAAAPASSGDTAGDASGEVDAEGWPWSEEMHAATKSKTKAGLWRMKVGVTRPEPKAGFAKAGAADDGSTESNAAPAVGEASTSSVPATAGDDEDEFAAFRDAAAAADAKDSAAEASVAARKWTDADLGKLCNQAAVKLGKPDDVKALIKQYVPAGTVDHSRNIPEDKREDFAKAVEAKAGITFEG